MSPRLDPLFLLGGHRSVERKSLTLIYCHDCRQCNVEEWFVAVHPACDRNFEEPDGPQCAEEWERTG